MASNYSRTTTPSSITQQLQARCRTIVLRLKQSSNSNDSSEDSPQRLLDTLQKRVNDRFDILVRKFVIDEKEQIYAKLLEKLIKVKDPDTFLEAFIVQLYSKAVKQEEDAVSPNVNDEDQREIDVMITKATDKSEKK
jgi:hypothetical protein